MSKSRFLEVTLAFALASCLLYRGEFGGLRSVLFLLAISLSLLHPALSGPWKWLHSYLAIRIWRIALVIGTIVLAISWFALWTWSQSERPMAPAKNASMAVFMKCTRVGLPIEIAPHSTLHVVPISKTRLQAKNRGYLTVRNDTIQDTKWPSDQVMEEAKKQSNPSRSVWRCEVVNNGVAKVYDLSIPIRCAFGGDEQECIYQAAVDLLPVGKGFVFYLVNDCPVQAHAAWGPKLSLRAAGETILREAPLRRTLANPIEQVMIFLPSNTRLAGDGSLRGMTTIIGSDLQE